MWALIDTQNGKWFEAFPDGTLKAWRVRIAQLLLVVDFPVSITAFVWDSVSGLEPQTCTTHSLEQPNAEDHAHWVRYWGLLAAFVLPVFLVQDPLGAGSLACLICQIISLAEILHLNSLQEHYIGPVMLGVLGSFHFVRTGHQATLSSIQWRSAFISLHTVHYPWSPLLVLLNTFGAQILAAVAVPLLPLWRRSEKIEVTILASKISGAVIAHLLYYGVINLGTTIWAAILRRHLMLYRVFCPRFMMGAVVLLIVDMVSMLISLNGARLSALPRIRYRSN